MSASVLPVATGLLAPARAWLALALLALCFTAQAQPAGNPAPLQFNDAAEETRFRALAAELRCVLCQNQSLADSHAQIAQDMRREVLELMRQGRSDAQIKQFLVDRYGEFVLYRPLLERHTLLLWFGPAGVLLVGAAVVWRIVRRRAAGAAHDNAGTGAASEGEQEW
ncbi:cytochrome c-type biogenesis protein [Pseudoxanthomonas koreensis]|uniref:cytochrome c-type biogenesis protein n=1 Tax=Pseudoxanthomonas koreensis TaxID=266061 RepID=UPI0035A68BAD